MKWKIILLVAGLTVFVTLFFLFIEETPLEQDKTLEYAKTNIAQYEQKKVILELPQKVIVEAYVHINEASGDVDHFWMEDVELSFSNEGGRKAEVDEVTIHLGKSRFERDINVSLEPGGTKKYRLYHPPFPMWLEKELGTEVKGAIKVVSNNTTTVKNFTIPAVIVDNISEIAGTSEVSLTPIGWRQSDIVAYHYEGSNYTFTAKPGMKFVILAYRLHNNWKEEQRIPFLDAGELATDEGKVYDIWKPSQEYISRKTEEKALDSGTYEILLPGETINGQVVFEVSENEMLVYVSISNIPAYITFSN
ncbi:MAG: hypothetical protein ACLFVX_01825 [Archaeoglobaceae archaeon]